MVSKICLQKKKN